MAIKADIVVVGSCMIDFVSYTSRLPNPGETIHGTKFSTNFGGKGANQCVAAAKLGANTALIARLGDDLWANRYLENLQQHYVNIDNVWKTSNSSSGIAQIIVSKTGNNQIVIVAGANNHLSIPDINNVQNVIQSADVVVLQLETSHEVAIETLKYCEGISILNGAPALSNYNPELLKLPTIFCVNETESEIFTGLPVTNLKEAEIAAKDLIAKGCNSVILTLGSQGVLYVDKNQKLAHIECPKVECVDSTGAGDAFIGALSYFLAYKKDWSIEKTIEASCYIASDSVKRPGTQISFPGKSILNELL